MADWVIKQGTTRPEFEDALTYSDGTVVNLTGATVAFVMRDHSQPAVLALTGTVTLTDAAAGELKFTPTTADTTRAGLYMASWIVTFPGGATMAFPTEGYNWVTIEESLSTTGGETLVSLPDAKDYLSIPSTDHVHDAKLVRFIYSVRPIVESITGPIIPTVYDEWHDGGQRSIRLRRRPSRGFGTTPVLDLIGCVEYRGPVQYTLRTVANPGAGDIYSVMLDPLGFVYRRSAGGGAVPFPPGTDTVHVFYRAGQAAVPANVYEGTLELIRLHYQRTQQSGRSRAAARGEEDEPSGTPIGFFVPSKVRELLQPTRRGPSIA